MSWFETVVRIRGWESEDDLIHWTCCEDEDLALCGQDLSDCEDMESNGDDECVVCNDLLANQGCPRHLTCRGES